MRMFLAGFVVALAPWVAAGLVWFVTKPSGAPQIDSDREFTDRYRSLEGL